MSAPGPGSPLAWQSRFGSVTFNLLGRGFPLGGMNEKGLVIEEANYSPSRYPRSAEKQVNEFQWIQYHLDTCATTGSMPAHSIIREDDRTGKRKI